jgi:nucleoid-associated protein YgaU
MFRDGAHPDWALAVVLGDRAILAAMTDPIDPSEPTDDPTQEPAQPEPTHQESPAATGAAPDAGERRPNITDVVQQAEPPPVERSADLRGPTAGLPRAAVVATPTAAGPSAARPVPMLAGRRQFARTTPVVIDRGRASFGMPSLGDRRQLGQIGLVVLMLAALGAILLARIGLPETPGVTGGSPSAHASAHPSPKASAHPTVQPSVSPGASSPAKSPGPSPSSKPKTYKVKTGDTLSSIASKFNTTAKVIEQLNDIKSPFVIHPGEILKLP